MLSLPALLCRSVTSPQQISKPVKFTRVADDLLQFLTVMQEAGRLVIDAENDEGGATKDNQQQGGGDHSCSNEPTRMVPVAVLAPPWTILTDEDARRRCRGQRPVGIVRAFSLPTSAVLQAG